MERRISGFHQDDVADWVAELDCGHARHVRHAPPFVERPWVASESDRRSRIGTPLECGACERRELPAGFVAYRRTPIFDETSVPRALLSRHSTKTGVWARIHVLETCEDFRQLALGDVHNDVQPPAVAHSHHQFDGATLAGSFENLVHPGNQRGRSVPPIPLSHVPECLLPQGHTQR